ncbi:MAG: hypothetical protein Q8S02_07415 [Hydrogenophaga sp.]|nr:hypothetical protein [Hydrogenophaga sp.]
MKTPVGALLGSLLVASPAWSTPICNTLFGTQTTVTSEQLSYCEATAQGLVDRLSITDFQAQFDSYTDNAAVNTSSIWNGVAVNAGFAANSTALSLDIPDLQVNETFVGSTREQSITMLKNWYNQNSDLVSRMLRQQAANSPNSLITGSNGLLQSMVATDFATAFSDNESRSGSNAASAGNAAPASPLGLGVVLSHMKVAGVQQTALGIPISYTVRNDIDPRRQALLRADLSALKSGGAMGYQARFSAGYQFPMSDEWKLAARGTVGFVGSADAATLATMVGASIASAYTIEFDGFDLSIGNMLGYYQTLTAKAESVSVNPGIKNTALRNGIILSQPMTVGGRKMVAEYGIADTRFFGTKIYQTNLQEFSFSLGTRRSEGARSSTRITGSYVRGKDAKGFQLYLNHLF